MSPNIEVGNALGDLQALARLKGEPGWKVLCDKFDERFAELTAKMLSLDTPPAEAEILRQARGRIERDFAPQTLMEDLLAKLQGLALRKIDKANNNHR